MLYFDILKFLFVLWTLCVVSVTSEDNLEKRDVIHRIVIMDNKPKKHKYRHKDHHHHHHDSSEIYLDYFKNPNENKKHKHKHSFEDDTKSFSRESFEHKHKASASNHRPHYHKRPKFDSTSEESISQFQQEHNFDDQDSWRPLIGKSRPTSSSGFLENSHKEKKKKHSHRESHHKNKKSNQKRPSHELKNNNHQRPNRQEYPTNISPNIQPFQSFQQTFEHPFPQIMHFHKKPNDNRLPTIETIEQFPASSNANLVNIPTSISSFGNAGPIKSLLKNGNTVSSITTISSPHSNIQTFTTTNHGKNHNHKIIKTTQSPNLKNHKITYQVHEPINEPIRPGLTYKELSPLIAMAETQIYDEAIEENKHKKITTTKSPTKNAKSSKRPRSSRNKNKHRN